MRQKPFDSLNSIFSLLIRLGDWSTIVIRILGFLGFPSPYKYALQLVKRDSFPRVKLLVNCLRSLEDHERLNPFVGY
jgi:hypothetical protein